MDSSEGSTQVSQVMVPPNMTSGPKEPLQNFTNGKTESPPMTLSDLNLVLRIDSSDSEDFSSYSEEDSPSPQRRSNGLPPKRRRSQPVKFEPGPIGPKKHIGGKSPKSVPYKKKSKNCVPFKLRSCGQCEGCLRDECGKCVFCKDKPKYGGPNKKRKRCIHRTCTNKDSNKNAMETREDPTFVPSNGPSAAAGRRSLEKSTVSGQVKYNKGSSPNLPSSEVKTPTLRSEASKGLLKSVLLNAKPETKRSPDHMTCVDCGRDRTLSMARTDQFCSQRCATNWQESQTTFDQSTPTRKVAKASAATEAADASPAAMDSPSNPLPLALRKLQINMAKPGTKLNAHPGAKLNANTESKMSAEGVDEESGNTRSSLISSLANIISQSHQQVDPPKAALAVKTVTPAKVAAKRSSTVQLISSSSAKKAKMVSKPVSQSSKSVSFNLKHKENGTSHSSSPSATNVLPLITSMFQSPKTSIEPVTIALPSNIPTDVCQWTVNHVVQYFMSTADCCNYADLFEAQEVDGIALLLLTHETLVKCLGVKLGLALKIMHRVEELKRFQNQNRSTK